jgi:hypothetical protein
MNGIEENEKSKKNETTDEEDLSDEDDDDDEDDYDYDNMLENFTTCIDSNDEVDEFIIFRDTLQGSL